MATAVLLHKGQKKKACHVIGIVGPISAGKSTVADLIRECGQDAGCQFTNIKMAGPLKDMLRSIGLSQDEIEGDMKERPSDKLCGRTPRWAMQSLGTEWGRDLIHPDLWINLWCMRVKATLARGIMVTSDDVRYQNEVDVVREFGGTIIEVQRPSLVAANDHKSEALKVGGDIVIKNDGSIEDLRLKVAAALELWKNV